ncbi:hypothetical protein glysoja_036823 [Glycine soja]|uniref:Uncharacterized protein n=1 Tax=Glycine soja TaxID=3848 RepID=A0A0B2RP38_GLYSO|nr:hypothetical protein glysoja_036823 [Glycine soja]
MRGQEDQQSRVFCELSALVFNLLRSPSIVPEPPARRSPAGADYSGGVRVATARDFGGADAVWIGDFLHRVHADAVGSRIGYGVLRRWRRFLSLRSRAFYSLLRYAT